MTRNFTVELRPQEEWAWLLAIDLFLGGMGGGLFLLFLFFDLSAWMVILSMFLVISGGIVLLAELGHPLRAWRAIARPLTSWISRGVISVLLFLITASLYIAPAFNAFSWLPWGLETLLGKTLGIFAGLSAFLVVLYPGLVLSASPSIPFWNNAILPVIFFTQSVMAANGLALLASFFIQSPQRMDSILAYFIILNLVLVSIYLFTMRHSGLAARESVRILSTGPLRWTFCMGVLFVGMILPLALLLWLPSAVVLAGALVLTGAFLLRYCVLKAAVYVPFSLV
jgi:formate-dependent nitrite reductase membrane component NrfD